MEPRDDPTDGITSAVTNLELHHCDNGLLDHDLGGQTRFRRGWRSLDGFQKCFQSLFCYGTDKHAIEKPLLVAECLNPNHAREDATAGAKVRFRKGQGQTGLRFKPALEYDRDPLHRDLANGRWPHDVVAASRCKRLALNGEAGGLRPEDAAISVVRRHVALCRFSCITSGSHSIAMRCSERRAPNKHRPGSGAGQKWECPNVYTYP